MKMLELENFRVKAAPQTAYYIPNFITSDEEKHLLEDIYSSPKPKWTNLSNRRSVNCLNI